VTLSILVIFKKALAVTHFAEADLSALLFRVKSFQAYKSDRIKDKSLHN